MSRGLTCSQETTVVKQPFISYQRNTNQISFAIVKNISALRLYLISHSVSGNLCSLKWTVTEIAVNKVSFFLTRSLCECVSVCCFVKPSLSLIRDSLYWQKEKVLFQITRIYQQQNVTIVYLEPISQALSDTHTHTHWNLDPCQPPTILKKIKVPVKGASRTNSQALLNGNEVGIERRCANKVTHSRAFTVACWAPQWKSLSPQKKTSHSHSSRLHRCNHVRHVNVFRLLKKKCC